MPKGPCLRLCCLALAILVFAPMARAAPRGTDPKLTAKWKKDLDQADAWLRSGEWAKGEEAADRVLEEMTQRLAARNQVGPSLGTALLLRGLGRLGEGRHDDGIWDLEMAWNLDPPSRAYDLTVYRPVGESLAVELACYRERFEEARKLPAVPGAPPCRKAAAEGGGVAAEPVRVGGDVLRPHKTFGSSPLYLPGARRGCVGGQVITEILIDETGKVHHPVVLQGAEPLLIYSTLHGMRDWRFRPAELAGGKPVAAYYTLTTSYQVDGGGCMGK